MHLVRNAVDHGIEAPSDRVRLGKPSRGTVDINVCHKAGQVVIEIKDDGKGIDVQNIEGGPGRKASFRRTGLPGCRKRRRCTWSSNPASRQPTR